MTTKTTKLIVLIIGLILSGCGSNSGGTNQSSGGSCSSSILTGTWKNAVDTLTFNADCSGTGSGCQSSFTFPNVSAASGEAIVNITSSLTKSGCSSVGQTKCVYVVNSNVLTFNCGAGTASYTR